MRAWKTFDWDALDRLHEQGTISNPKSKAKSVALSKGRQLLRDRLALDRRADGRAARLHRHPAVVFSGPGRELETFPSHSPDDARRLHNAVPGSQLEISSERLGDQWEAVLDQLRPDDRTFEPLVAALAAQIDALNTQDSQPPKVRIAS